MQKLIVLAAIVACSLAAPVENIKETFQIADLARPSPINPDVPSDPKPEERVTLITDDLPTDQLASVDAQLAKLPGPLVLPREPLSRSKREDKDSSESDESDSSEEDKKPVSHSHGGFTPSKPVGTTSTTAAPAPVNDESDVVPSSSSTTNAPVLASRKPYSPKVHQHNEHLFKPTTEATETSAAPSSTTTAAAVPSDAHVSDKRDIPVPLTRSHQAADVGKKQKEEPDTAKASKEEVKQEEEKKDEDQKPVPAAHPATIARPIPVAELFAKKPSTAASTD